MPSSSLRWSNSKREVAVGDLCIDSDANKVFEVGEVMSTEIVLFGRGLASSGKNGKVVDDLSGLLHIKIFSLNVIPKNLLEALQGIIGTYGVCLTLCMKTETGHKHLPHGSGVLVKSNGRCGILTARHNVHSSKSSIRLGEVNEQHLEFGLANYRNTRVRVPCGALVEVELCDVKNYSADGPDVTFIELPRHEVANIESYSGGFWNIDKQLTESPVVDASVTCYVSGYPYEKAHHIEHNSRPTLMNVPIMMGGLLEENEYLDDSQFDYIKVTAAVGEVEDLPKDFEGISGGGVWVFDFQEKPGGTIKIKSSQLVGIAFYQEFLKEKQEVILSCHFQKVLTVLQQKLA